LKAYTNAINLKSNHFNSYYWRGSVNYDLNDFQASSNDWQSALKLQPENNSTLYWIAKSQFNLSNYENALVFIDKYLTNENKDKEAYILRGECYAQTSQISNAKKDWQEAKDLGHNNIAYYLNKYGLDNIN
jgi:tetratricopeptide (TPR) repeat protein